ncbi:TIGR02391 family protein [Micromonospora sp. NPDC049257]|uniref:TIGR02391 family protein n=1 Tax=Micromonospora sp. NPDC049257 TaxID=3155771 RepID=UPI00341690BD
MQNWTLTADEVRALPLDELALRVLASAQDAWNWRNWLLEVRQDHYPRDPETVQLLAEAWGWLQAKCLIAWTVDQSAAEAFTTTRRGREFLRHGAHWLQAVERLDVDLVPELEFTARPQFLRGDYETAAFTAMKEVEVQVRRRAGLSDSMVGTKLMQEAFRPPKNPRDQAGPLWRDDLDPGESVAQMELFKGAIGLFKNPSSHRRVDYSDPTEAAETVLLADLLLRLLRKIPEGPFAGEGADLHGD